MEKHDHPACKTEDKHIHEKAFVSNSAGGEISEGCVEHYFDRIITVDDEEFAQNRTSKLVEYVVMSEILGKPKCKR